MTSSWPKQKCRKTETDNALRWQKLNSKTLSEEGQAPPGFRHTTTAIAAVHLVSL